MRRAAVPFGKMSRPFGASGTITAVGNGAVVENFVPREMAPIHEPEPFDAAVPEQVAEAPPPPFVPVDEQSADLTPASVSEVPELALCS